MPADAPVPEMIWIAMGHTGWLWEVAYHDRARNCGGVERTLDEAMRAVSETVQNARGAG